MNSERKYSMIKCRIALEHAAKNGEPKTSEQWAAIYGLRVTDIYYLVRQQHLNKAIMMPQEVPVRDVTIGQTLNRNKIGVSYPRHWVRIGKLALMQAGMLGKPIRQTIENGKITLELKDNVDKP